MDLFDEMCHLYCYGLLSHCRPGVKKRTVPETKNMTRIAHNICPPKDLSIVLFIFSPFRK
jgi:hypothetical protein